MHARPALRPLLAIAAIALFVLSLAACGKDSKDDASDTKKDPTTTVAPKGDGEGGKDEDAPTIVAKDFSLTSATVEAGKEVYVDNQGAATHTLTADDGSFDTGKIEGGKTAELDAPSAPGTYTFHCSIHPRMTGTLTVQ